MTTPTTVTRKTMEAVGKQMREERRARNLTQVELAGRLGLKQTDISEAEHGRTHVLRVTYTVEKMRDSTKKMSEFLGICVPDVDGAQVVDENQRG